MGLYYRAGGFSLRFKAWGIVFWCVLSSNFGFIKPSQSGEPGEGL